MRKTILIAIILIIFISFASLYAQWARTYGGSDYDSAYSIQQTSDGGYIVAGRTGSVGAGIYHIWVLKLSSTGTIDWQHTYGGSGDDEAYSIQQTSDGGYIVAGRTTSFGAGDCDAWILKLSSIGDVEWQRTYGGSGSDSADSIQQTSDGGYIVAGDTNSITGYYHDFWVLKLSSTGDVEWQRTYGGSVYDFADSIQQTSDGGYIVAGQTNSFGAGSGDFWVLKLSSTGDVEWQRTYGGSGNDNANSIQQTSDGGYIIAGITGSFGAGGNCDTWILKLSSTGDVEWQRTYGGSGDDNANSIQQTSDGGYIVAGQTTSPGARSNDFWIFKLSSTGDVEWQRTYGGRYSEMANSIQQTSDGGYIAAGYTQWFSAGNDDFWVLKLYSDGDIDASCDFIGSLNVTITDTLISPVDTSITPQDTDVTPLDTMCSIQDTYAAANLLCDAPKYTLTISTTDRGTTDPAPGSYIYYKRSEVKIKAIPDAGYSFLHWTGDVPSGHENDNPITITMDSDKSIKANFQHTLTIIAGTGGTVDPPPGIYNYDVGTEVTITAMPETNYRFSGWTGDVPFGHENDNPLSITIDSDKSVTANFIRQYTLTIAAGTGGTTDPVPGHYIYDSGTQVSIKAIPNSGYQFSGWSGAASGTTNPITITMDSDKSVTANFKAVSTGGGGGGKGICFIATAAYGSPLHPHVEILRDFRDKYLMPSKIGRMMVSLYYKYSPSLANFISKHKVLKVVVQITLLPLVVFSYSMVHFGLIVTVVMLIMTFMIPIFFIWTCRSKLRRVEAKDPKVFGLPDLKKTAERI
jgi:uncharacterized repeat protein (TIGR02543 family)/uncharacterized delta-60 repeat protein